MSVLKAEGVNFDFEVPVLGTLPPRWAPISDRNGRRLPVAIGMALLVLGSAGCGRSTHTLHLIGRCVVQALGACSGVALARAAVPPWP